MSKLETLIQQLCPDGVEYKKLNEVVEIKRGIRVVRSQLFPDGKYPVYQNSLTPLGYYEKSNVRANTTFIIAAGAAGEIGYSTVDFWAADDCFYFECGKIILNKYIYYLLLKNKYLLLSKVRKASIPRLSRVAIEQLLVPVPPLEIQHEIVYILDHYTEVTMELIDKLSVELTNIQKQYEYYKEHFLALERANMQWMPLGKICNIARGASPRPIRNFITKDNDGINWIKIGDVAPGAKYITSCSEKITIDGAKKSKVVYPGDFILSNSMSFGRPYILKIKGCIHDGWLSISGFEDYVPYSWGISYFKL